MGVRVGGTATVKVDGNQYALRGNLEVIPSSLTREGVAGQDYVHGFTEMPLVPSIKGEFTTVPGLSLEAIQGIIDSTVQASLANGSVYILSDAWTKAAFRIDSVRGQVEITWEGLICDEITA